MQVNAKTDHWIPHKVRGFEFATFILLRVIRFPPRFTMIWLHICGIKGKERERERPRAKRLANLGLTRWTAVYLGFRPRYPRYVSMNGSSVTLIWNCCGHVSYFDWEEGLEGAKKHTDKHYTSIYIHVCVYFLSQNNQRYHRCKKRTTILTRSLLGIQQGE